jgi:hypothetical protein
MNFGWEYESRAILNRKTITKKEILYFIFSTP